MYFILTILIIVFIHEFGHYLAAKICGVYVEEFCIGFGKKLVSRRDSSGTLWSIAIIPLGGYVKLFGENEKVAGGFASQSLLKKSIIVAAGPFANYVLTFIILLCYNFLFPTTTNYVEKVLEGSPADIAGILPDDQITKFNDEEISNFSSLKNNISSHPNQNVALEIMRDGYFFTIKVNISSVDYSGKSFGFLGIEPQIEYLSKIAATKQTFAQIYDFHVLSIKAIMDILSGDVKHIGGPVQIAKYSSNSAKDGIISYIFAIAILSFSVGFMNLLPIPILDGGHLLRYLIEYITKKTFSDRLLYFYNLMGIVLLSMLFAIAITNDFKL